MSEIQQSQQQSNKKKNRKKRSKTNRVIVNSDSNATGGAVAKTNPITNKTPLHTSVAQKQSTPIVSRKSAGSNWEANQPVKQKSNEPESVAAKNEETIEVKLSKSARHRQKRRAAEEKYVALDCEMVGVGINGRGDMLARVTIVSKRGEVLLDKFVKPQQAVTDYRTQVSGIRPHDINNGEDFKSVQEEVMKILQGKILIGHAIMKDLYVLRIKHPQCNIRDTSRYKPLCNLVTKGRVPSLKRLAQAILGIEIQIGEHNSIEDARAAMSIYNLLAKDWEAYIKRRQQNTGK